MAGNFLPGSGQVDYHLTRDMVEREFPRVFLFKSVLGEPKKMVLMRFVLFFPLPCSIIPFG